MARGEFYAADAEISAPPRPNEHVAALIALPKNEDWIVDIIARSFAERCPILWFAAKKCGPRIRIGNPGPQGINISP